MKNSEIVFLPRWRNGYVMLNGVLTKVNIDMVTAISLEEMSFTYRLRSINDGSIVHLTDPFFFEDESLYRQGIPYASKTPIGIVLNELLRNTPINVRMSGDEVSFYSYVLSDNGAEEVDLTDKLTKIVFDISGYVSYNIPMDGMYKTAKEVFFWNDYIIEDEMGKRVKKAPLKSMSLDVDQNALVTEFKNLCLKMKESGLQFIMECDSNDLSLVNGRKVTLGSYYEGCESSEGEELHEDAINSMKGICKIVLPIDHFDTSDTYYTYLVKD